MHDLTLHPLPRKLADAADRLGLTPHVRHWESMADGRSNHGRTEVFLLALDVPPGVIALKFAGITPSSREALARERTALVALKPWSSTGASPVPRLFHAPALLEHELAIEFLPGVPYERYLGRGHDPAALAQDLATALAGVWSLPGDALPPGASTKSLIDRLRGVIDPSLEESLDAWLPPDTATALAHGDLRPSNILVRDVDGVPRLSGFIDWSMAAHGSPADDQVMLEFFAAPVHRDLPALVREALPPMEPASRRTATIRLLCRLLGDTARARDWEAFRRNERELANQFT